MVPFFGGPPCRLTEITDVCSSSSFTYELTDRARLDRTPASECIRLHWLCRCPVACL